MENLNIELLGVNMVVLNPYVEALEKKKAIGIILQEKDKKDLIKKSDLDKLKVLKVSKDCTLVKEGNFIKIKNDRIPSLESFCDGKYLILSQHDVLFIYK